MSLVFNDNKCFEDWLRDEYGMSLNVFYHLELFERKQLYRDYRDEVR